MYFVGRLPGAAQDGKRGRAERNGREAFGRSSIFRLRPSGVRYVEGNQYEPERSPPCRRYGPPSAFSMPPRQPRQPLFSAGLVRKNVVLTAGSGHLHHPRKLWRQRSNGYFLTDSTCTE